LKVFLVKAIGWVLEHLPLRADKWITRSLSKVTVGRSRQTRANVERNMRHALGDSRDAVSMDVLVGFRDRVFTEYAHYWAEGAKLPRLKKSIIRDGFTLSEGREYLDAAKAVGKGVIVVLPHIGSWEWGGAYLDSIGFGLTAVAEELEPPSLFEWFKKKREEMGISVIGLNDQAGAVLLDTLSQNKTVALLSDRDIQNNGIAVTFFGEQVSLPPGPAVMALRTGAPLLTAACYAGPLDGHHAVINPPIQFERSGKFRADVAALTQVIAFELEGLIRRAPEQWHDLQPRFQND
jgi:phosphatidylinositol dimannoside acyltransferase